MTGRQTLPENITYLWNEIVNSLQGQYGAPMIKVMKLLVNEALYPNAQAEELIRNALNDGLIIMSNVLINGRFVKHLRIPNLDEIEINEDENDHYCYECHIPSDNLQKCLNCPRVFHEECYRIDPDIPNNARSVVPNKRHVKKPFKCDVKFLNNSNSENIEENLLTKKTRSQQRNNSNQNNEEIIENEIEDDEETRLVIDVNSYEDDEDNEKIDDYKLPVENEDIKPSSEDCIWIGPVRPPSRRLSTSMIKCEDNDNNENEEQMERMLCSHCRIISKKFRDPPNMTIDDVNYLLRFVFDRIKTWISLDTFSPSPKGSNSWALPDKKYLNIFMKLCFKFPKFLSEIDKKIKNKEYTSLTEFQCDFMDIQHCIGILYGCQSHEYAAVVYQMRDCVYELSEIRICPDCYRNSNERKSNWFCRPCVTRHELVFAKQGRFSYWPAKVLRLFKNQYDVRFFGTNHSRALIDYSNIKPIDIDLNELKIKYTVTFKKAMDELREHQELLQLPFDQSQTVETFSNVGSQLKNSKSPGRPKNKKQRKQQKQQNQQNHQIQQNQQQNQPSEQNQQNQSFDGHITGSDDAMILMTTEVLPSTSPKGSNKRKRKSCTVTSFTMDDEFNGEDNNDVTINKKPKASAVASKIQRIKSLLKTLGIREFYCRKSTIGEALPSSSATMNVPATTDAATSASSSIPMSTLNKRRTSTVTEQYKRRASVFQEDATTSAASSSISMSTLNKRRTSTVTEQYKRRASVFQEEPVSSTEDSTIHTSVENFAKILLQPKKANEIRKAALESFKIIQNFWQTKIEHIKEQHENEIHRVKKEPWCCYCEKPAMYYCCWNTNYCSIDCQQKHWREDHKGKCKPFARRIRVKEN